MPQPGSPVEQRQTNSLQVSHGGYQDDSLSRVRLVAPRTECNQPYTWPIHYVWQLPYWF